MKILISTIAILILGLGISKAKEVKITIEGRVIAGELPQEITYTKPINGYYYWGFKESAVVDSKGKFKIKLSIDEPCFISIRCSKSVGYMLLDPEVRNHKIAFDLSDLEDKKFIIESEDKDAQSLLNKFDFYPPGGYRMKDTTIQYIKTKSDIKMDKKIAPIQDLYKADRVGINFLSLSQKDRECYYSIIKGNFAGDKFMGLLESGQDVTVAKESWSNNFDKDKEFKNSMYFHSWLQYRIDYRSIEDHKFNMEEYSIMMRDIKDYHTFNIEEAKKIISDEETLEFYTAQYIHSSAYQKRFEKELIILFNQFKERYPSSPYTKYITPLIEEIEDYYIKVDGNNFEDISFIENYQQLNNLEEVIQNFKGKDIYIDVWATWCGPCKEEFKHKEELYKVLKESNTQIVYLSIDKDKYRAKWREMIKYFDLKGYHIRANDSLKGDLEKIFSPEGKAIRIPWYISIDKTGKITEKHAPRPSQIDQLRE